MHKQFHIYKQQIKLTNNYIKKYPYQINKLVNQNKNIKKTK